METSENRGEHIPELVVQPPGEVFTVPDQAPEGTRQRALSSASNQSTSTYYTAYESPVSMGSTQWLPKLILTDDSL